VGSDQLFSPPQVVRIGDDGPEFDEVLTNGPLLLAAVEYEGARVARVSDSCTLSSVSTICGDEIAPCTEDPWSLPDLQDNSPKWSGGYSLSQVDLFIFLL